MCLNRAPRRHRLALIAKLLERDLFNSGLVSYNFTIMGAKPAEILETVESGLGQRWSAYFATHPVNIVDVDNSHNLAQNNISYELMRGTFVNLTTETHVGKTTLQLTEKIWKPLIAGQPFMLLSSPGTLRYLKNVVGIKTYSDWWNEDYDHCENLLDRIQIICDNLSRYNTMSVEQLADIRTQMLPVTEYNKQCVREWVRKRYHVEDSHNHVVWDKPILDWLYTITTTLR